MNRWREVYFLPIGTIPISTRSTSHCNPNVWAQMQMPPANFPSANIYLSPFSVVQRRLRFTRLRTLIPRMGLASICVESAPCPVVTARYDVWYRL